MTDMVNEPPHYKSDSGLEAIDVIRAFFKDNYTLGTVFKYIARCGKKLDDIEDLKKARKYLDWEIEWREETGDDSPPIEAFTPYPDDRDPQVGDRVLVSVGSMVFGNGLAGEVARVDSRDLPFPYYVRFDDDNIVPYKKNELWCRID